MTNTTHCPYCRAKFKVKPLTAVTVPVTAFSGQIAACPTCSLEFVLKLDEEPKFDDSWIYSERTELVPFTPKWDLIESNCQANSTWDEAIASPPIKQKAKHSFLANLILAWLAVAFFPVTLLWLLLWTLSKCQSHIKPAKNAVYNPLSFDVWYHQHKWYGSAPPLLQMALWVCGGFIVLPIEHRLWVMERKGQISRGTRLTITIGAILGLGGLWLNLRRKSLMQEQASMIAQAIKNS